MKFLNNIVTAYDDKNTEQKDSADIVQTIILVAGFAVVTILVVSWIGTAIMNKGADVAECIEGSDTYNGSNDNCKNVDHSKDNSFKDDEGYKGRYNG